MTEGAAELVKEVEVKGGGGWEEADLGLEVGGGR